MRCALLGLLLVAAIAGCGGDEESPRALTSGFVTGPATVDEQTERIYTTRPRPYEPPAGKPVDARRVVADAGCLACHQIASEGNSGPGSNLAGIGARRSRAQIRAALVAPPPPMPSYRDLPRRTLDVVVAYLSSLRDGAGCADGSDCG